MHIGCTGEKEQRDLINRGKETDNNRGRRKRNVPRCCDCTVIRHLWDVCEVMTRPGVRTHTQTHTRMHRCNLTHVVEGNNNVSALKMLGDGALAKEKEMQVHVWLLKSSRIMTAAGNLTKIFRFSIRLKT